MARTNGIDAAERFVNAPQHKPTTTDAMTPRPASSFPPVWSGVKMFVDEASGLVLITGREQFGIQDSEITLPFPLVEALYSTMLVMRVNRAQQEAATAALAALSKPM